MLKHFQLILNVTCETDVEDEIAANLKWIAEHAASNGLITGDTDAEVDTWDYTVHPEHVELPCNCNH
jgi:hypothetical protein